jgi:hypothetical protein
MRAGLHYLPMAGSANRQWILRIRSSTGEGNITTCQWQVVLIESLFYRNGINAREKSIYYLFVTDSANEKCCFWTGKEEDNRVQD